MKRPPSRYHVGEPVVVGSASLGFLYGKVRLFDKKTLYAMSYDGYRPATLDGPYYSVYRITQDDSGYYVVAAVVHRGILLFRVSAKVRGFFQERVIERMPLEDVATLVDHGDWRIKHAALARFKECHG